MVLQGGPCGRVGHRRTSFQPKWPPNAGWPFRIYGHIFRGEGSTCRTTTRASATSTEVAPATDPAPDRPRLADLLAGVNVPRAIRQRVRSVRKENVLAVRVATVKIGLPAARVTAPIVRGARGIRHIGPVATTTARIARVATATRGRTVVRERTARAARVMRAGQRVAGSTVRDAMVTRGLSVATARAPADRSATRISDPAATVTPRAARAGMATHARGVSAARAVTRVPTGPAQRAMTAARRATVAPGQVHHAASTAPMLAPRVRRRISVSADPRFLRTSPPETCRVRRATS